MSIFSGIRVGVDEVFQDEAEDIVYSRTKHHSSDTYKVTIKELLSKPNNAFINNPNNSWGDEDDDDLSTMTEYTQGNDQRGNDVTPLLSGIRQSRLGDEDFDEEFPVENAMQVAVSIDGAGDAGGNEENPFRSGDRRTRIPGSGGRNMVILKEDRSLNIRMFTEKELLKVVPKTRIRKFFKNAGYYVNNTYRRVTSKINPFAFSVERIERSFGTGVASFYDLWKYIIYMNIAIFLIMFVLLLVPWFMRTDMSSIRKWGFIFEGNFYLGLLGFKSKEIGRTFFFYEGYGNILVHYPNNSTSYVTCDGENMTYIDSNVTFNCVEPLPFTTKLIGVIPYEFRFFYPIAIILYFLVCLLILVLSIGQRLRVVSKVDKSMKFSTGILGLWDHSVSGKSHIESMRKSISSAFLEYLEIEKQKEEASKSKTKKEIALLVLRRIIGWTVSLVLLIGGPTIILIISNGEYYEKLNSQFNITTTIIFSAINITFPKVLDWMVLLEKYSSARTIMYNRIIRKYVMKMSSLLSLIIRILTTYFFGSVSKNANSCIPVEAGIIIWQLIVVDFFTSFVDNIISNYLELMMSRGIKKAEFNTSTAISRIIYRQSVVWLGSLFSPLLAGVAVVSSTILFFARWAVMANTKRFPKKPVPNQMGNVFNQALFLITLLICLIPTIVFFAKDKYSCGPAYHHSLAEGIVIWQFSQNDYLTDIFSSVFQYVWIGFAIALMLAVIGVYLVFQRCKMFEERYDDQLKKLKQERILWEANYGDV